MVEEKPILNNNIAFNETSNPYIISMHINVSLDVVIS